jgi:hypothetical protein
MAKLVVLLLTPRTYLPMDHLLREAYEENLLMYGNNEPCWLRCIHILLKHLNMDQMLTHPENFKFVVTSTKTCKNVSMANISNIRNISFVSKYKLKFSICPKA